MVELSTTDRTRLRRKADRGATEPAAIYDVLDHAMICHVGFVDDGMPVVIPTSYGRDGDTLYLHGSTGTRFMRRLADGAPLCLTVTVVDGLVLARSVMHHSMNYRSAMVFGAARRVTDEAERVRAFEVIVEHLIPGRWADARQPTRRESAATAVVAVDLAEASVKLRTGPPGDDDADLGLPVWAGVLPITQHVGAPIPDDHVPADLPTPDYATRYRRPA